ncbi:hypothetical protein [uncultured Tenacibaculum sp.]|uniref:hypothetical protein n=1 Tax=uncultured Tenacibaculum sp. TaxID=174713 RepID=UPI002613A831|nr:hypothetical protein [uncultured Tenacibaculum sp.]
MKKSQAPKMIQQLQKATGERNQITEKVKKIFPLLFAIILGVSFYSYQFFDVFSADYNQAIKMHSIEKKKRTKALNKVKAHAEGTELYNNYLKAKKDTDLAYSKFKKVKQEEKVFGFKSFHFFIERLGLFFGFFCYALYNLFRSFYFERKNIGIKVVHGFILSVCLFYFFWIFQQFQDFSKATYILMTITSAAIIVLAVHLITKYQDHRINRLKKGQFELAKFTFKNTKPEKREEMLNTIERIVKEH